MPIDRQASRSAPRKRNIDVERRAQIGQEKRSRTRATLLEATFTLLGREKGLGTRIEEICAAASISRGSFYNYFVSMDELLEALSYELNHDFNNGVQEVVGRMATAAERAGAAIRYYLERALQDPQWAWAMVNISAGGPIFGAETYRHAQVTIEQGIASGEFDLPGPNSGRDLLLGTTLAAMVTQLHNPPSATYAASVTRNVLRGLGVAPVLVEDLVQRPLPDPLAR
jgi:AcrR family transcriptional regulator